MINLNDSDFDAKEGTAIFNEGKAGVVENVSISIIKKDKEDTSKNPDYKIIYKDESGAEINTGYWYLDESKEYFENNFKKLAKALKHLIHFAKGQDFKIPEFKDHKEMLDGCMKILKEGVVNKKARIIVNYGTTMSVSMYLRVRTFPPFIESMTVNLEESRLSPSDIEVMERPKADSNETTSSVWDDSSKKEVPSSESW